MGNISIKISKDFTDAPGSRYKSDGPNSGEEFYEKLLKPKFEEAKKESKKLFIDLDDSWGYASSFVSGAFGRLADEFGVKESLDILTFKSEDDPTLVEKIKDEIKKSKKDE